MALSLMPSMARKLSQAYFVHNEAKDGVVSILTAGHGSGFLVSEDGLIITNSHVVKNSNKFKVRFADNKQFDAKLLYQDRDYDIAVLWINMQGLHNYKVLKLSSSKPLVEIGEEVYAIGTPIDESLNSTITKGIVSKLKDAVITHDASLNGGNSGGPLLNADSVVVGVNTFVISDRGAALSNAVSIDKAFHALEEARKQMTTESKPEVFTTSKQLRKSPYPIKEIEFPNLKKDPKVKDYVMKSDFFRFVFFSPLTEYRELKRHEEKMLKRRKKKAQKHDFEISEDEYLTKNMPNYVTQDFTKPSVTVYAIPIPKATKASVFKKVLGTAAGIAALPFDSGVTLALSSRVGNTKEIKRYFQEFKIVDEAGKQMCNPIREGRVDLTEQLRQAFARARMEFEDLAFAGVYEFDPYCFEKASPLYLSIESDGREEAKLKEIKPEILDILKKDFEPYWRLTNEQKI